MIGYSLKEAEKVWFISDTHFDHANIIKYCSRPFKSAKEMNATIGRNWNNTIAPTDIAYFLGDMAFGRGSRKPRWWPQWLNGKIIWIKGSHDRGIRPSSTIKGIVRVVNSFVISCDSTVFMLVHDAFDATLSGWHGWIIHGHTHNSRSHIDVVRKRVNVSVEVIGYKPVSLAEIVRRIK